MTELRDAVEQSGSGLLSVNKRVDAVLLAVADLYRKLAAMATMFDDEATEEAVAEAVRELSDKVAAAGVFEAVAKLEALSPEALDKFLRDREAARRSEPYISTDRSPRRVRRLVEDQKATTPVVIGPDGTILGEDRED